MHVDICWFGRRAMTRRAMAIVATIGLMLMLLPGHGAPPAAQAATSVAGLHVSGNQLLNGAGQPVVLHGVNRSGTEYQCVHGSGIFDGPSDAASVAAIAAWQANAVRIPLNEDCWLGINGVNPAYAGAAYQQAIGTYVNLVNAAGMAAILDLHWSAPGGQSATGQQPMPDRDHSPAFWQGVATTFKGNLSVLFDLYNEPYPDSNQGTTAAWTCWRDGGTCPGVSFQAAGMQELVNTVRAAGAANVIMLGGVQYANDLSQWLTYRPSDPQHNLAASWHEYNFNACRDSSCWDSALAPVAAQVPLITGEIGEDDCGHGFIDGVMGWLDAHNAGYLAWVWDTWSGGTCQQGSITLISDYNGTPIQQMGQGYHDHLACLAQGVGCAPQPTPTPTPATAPLVLYDNAVAPGWADYSFTYSARNPQDPAFHNSPPYSYAISYDGYGGIQFYKQGFNPVPYATLEWYLNPHGLPITDFSALFQAGSNVLNEVYLGSSNDLGTAANGFHHISVPVGQLDPGGVQIDSVQLKNALGSGLPSVNVDDVSFVPAMPQPTATATATSSPLPPTATATTTPVPATATATNSPVPPTATATNTPVPASATATTVPPTPTATNTAVPATPTATATAISVALAPVADTYVRDGSYANTNYGTATSLYSKRSGTGYNRAIYLRFDLSTIHGSVTAATLRLFGRYTGAAGSSVQEAVYPVASTTWVESGGGGITWNTRPATGATAAAQATVATTATYVAWSVTGAVAGHQGGLLSLAVAMPATAASPDQFNAREAASNRPQLLLTYR